MKIGGLASGHASSYHIIMNNSASRNRSELFQFKKNDLNIWNRMTKLYFIQSELGTLAVATVQIKIGGLASGHASSYHIIMDNCQSDAGKVQYCWKASDEWSDISIQIALFGSAWISSIIPPRLNPCKVNLEASRPSLEVTALNWNPVTASSGKLEHWSFCCDIFVTNHHRQILEGFYRTEQRILCQG